MSDSRRDVPVAGGHGRSGPATVRERLAADRTDTLARMAALGRDFDGIVAANALVAVDDEHDPEGGTTAFERAHVASLMEQAHGHLAELDEALQRLERGTYGQCEGCGSRIPPERLEIRPAATTCVSCAEPGRRRPRRPAR
ncbi:TraR/DksA family transcriptional regulator [Streptomyces sp. NPDC013740]|uniref:TraR/DksA family transcriptional regulator n=1 Tax=Streptomyces sp. NPDC013740 TaxID=3364867 RepID=UPI0036F623D8